MRHAEPNDDGPECVVVYDFDCTLSSMHLFKTFYSKNSKWAMQWREIDDNIDQANAEELNEKVPTVEQQSISHHCGDSERTLGGSTPLSDTGDGGLCRLRSLRLEQKRTKEAGDRIMQQVEGLEQLGASDADPALLERLMLEYMEHAQTYTELGERVERLVQKLEERFEYAHLRLTLNQAEISSEQAMQELHSEKRRAEERLAQLESEREQLLDGEHGLTMDQALYAFGTAEGLEESMLWALIRDDGLSEACEPLVKQIMEMGHQHQALQAEIRQWQDRIHGFEKLCSKAHPRANGGTKVGTERKPCDWPQPVRRRPSGVRFVGLDVNEYELEDGKHSVHREFKQWIDWITTGDWGD